MTQIATQLRLEEYLYAHLDEGRTFILYGEKTGVAIVISTDTPAGWNATAAAMNRIEGIYEQELDRETGRLPQDADQPDARTESLRQADPAHAGQPG